MDPELIFILILIVAPLIERVLKGARKGQGLPPEQDEEGPVWQPRGRDEETESEPGVIVARHADPDESAASVLPDDLWEILTGERRPPQPVPSPRQDDPEGGAYSLDIEPYDEWADDEPELRPAEVRPREVVRPREEVRAREDIRPASDRRTGESTLARPVPVRDASVVVTLEELEIDDERRHTDFHERLTALSVAPRGYVARPSVDYFATNEDLRRAIIVAEILGPPKSLQ